MFEHLSVAVGATVCRTGGRERAHLVYITCDLFLDVAVGHFVSHTWDLLARTARSSIVSSFKARYPASLDDFSLSSPHGTIWHFLLRRHWVGMYGPPRRTWSLPRFCLISRTFIFSCLFFSSESACIFFFIFPRQQSLISLVTMPTEKHAEQKKINKRKRGYLTSRSMGFLVLFPARVVVVNLSHSVMVYRLIAS